VKKLKLDLDALHVETFEAERTPEPRGTVRGHASSGDGGIFECANQCIVVGSQFGCASNFGCASVNCSGAACNSLSGCVSYEVINCGA
jgi:hypothetical protein